MRTINQLLVAVLLASACALRPVAGEEVLTSIFGGQDEHDEHVVDDETHWVKPAASPSELLVARGYLAQEFHFTTKDGYNISITRGRNPLINEGKSGYSSKLPILFVHGATVSAASYLLNSASVQPRVYEESLSLHQWTSKRLFQFVAEDPARSSFPFLAMNFGYEIWIMERRGFAGSRNRIGSQNRTVADAFKAIPSTLIGNSMNGFSLDANMDMTRPKRMRYARQAQSDAAQESKPETATAKIIKRILKDGLQLRRRMGPSRHANVLEAFFALAKLPSMFVHLVGNITQEFIQTFDPDFWRFSIDEQVEHDFPGALDFVLEQSGAPKVHVSGLSCGGAIILLALADQPQLAEKISRAVLWAPSVNMGSKTDIVYLLAFVIPMVQGFVGPVPFVFLQPIIEVLLQTLCSSDFMQRTVCTAAVDAIMGYSGNEAPMRPSMLGHMLQPTSSGELFQLGQFARSQFPCKYNLNSKEENVRKYGQERAPCYDLAQVQLHNISFYSGSRDRLVSPDDIATTVAQMSVPAEIHLIRAPRYNFNHLGCFLHRRADQLIILPSFLDIERSNWADQQPQSPSFASSLSGLVSEAVQSPISHLYRAPNGLHYPLKDHNDTDRDGARLLDTNSVERDIGHQVND